MDSNTPLQAADGSLYIYMTKAESDLLAMLRQRKRSPRTLEAWKDDFRIFCQWATARGYTPPAIEHFHLPLEIIEQYLTYLLNSGASIATVNRRLATLSGIHSRRIVDQKLGIDNPCTHPRIKDLLLNAKCQAAESGTVTTARAHKHPITRDVLDAMLSTCTDGMAGIRDRALLLFAWCSGGRRKSEVRAAKIENLQVTDSGYIYFMERSKTDQEGRGQHVPVIGRNGDAAAALKAWLDATGRTNGYIFHGLSNRSSGEQLSQNAINHIVSRRLTLAGLNSRNYCAHSLRSGFVTTSAEKGCNEIQIMAMTGHTSTKMVRHYAKVGHIKTNPAAML